MCAFVCVGGGALEGSGRLSPVVYFQILAISSRFLKLTYSTFNVTDTHTHTCTHVCACTCVRGSVTLTLLFFLQKIFNASEELKRAAHYPHVRTFMASMKKSDTEQTDLIDIQIPWSVQPASGLNYCFICFIIKWFKSVFAS